MPVSSAVVSRVALANAVANGLIVVTGGAVRLTGSGLGCPTWPECTDGSITPTAELAAHGLIEFGNRLLTFAVAVIAIATVVVVWRSARRELRRWAVLSFIGIPAQALLGGVTVLTGLNPWTVAAHFLLSMVLVAVATTLWLRSREPGVGQLLVRRPIALLVTGIALTVALVQVFGTVVTGSGPHSGDPDAGRTGLDPELMSQLHADVVFLLVGLTVALLVALYATDSPGRVRRAARDLLVVELAQGVIGYVQYFTGLPVVLVAAHMAGAVLISAYTARLLWAVRGPASELPADTPPRHPRRRPLTPPLPETALSGIRRIATDPRKPPFPGSGSGRPVDNSRPGLAAGPSSPGVRPLPPERGRLPGRCRRRRGPRPP